MIAESNVSVAANEPGQWTEGGEIGVVEQLPEAPTDSAIAWQEASEEFAEEFSRSGPDLWLYRDRTTGLLWRYTRLAVELGRLPSLLGREFFRARVSRYDAQTFEDTVIFVHDVECCLESLDAADRIVIAMLALEQYTQEEAAHWLHCTQRTIVRHYGEALDRLSEIFLKRELLALLPGESMVETKACQEATGGDLLVSDSE
jgi:DNA-directed RNA polymerase specialized sigma24 family protein